MRENVGGADRVVRAVVGPALVAWGSVLLGPAKHKVGPVALIVAGALTAETVLTRTCPLNAAMGADTAA